MDLEFKLRIFPGDILRECYSLGNEKSSPLGAEVALTGVQKQPKEKGLCPAIQNKTKLHIQKTFSVLLTAITVWGDALTKRNCCFVCWQPCPNAAFSLCRCVCMIEDPVERCFALLKE